MFRWPHGGPGECARARAGYGAHRWARGRPGRASAERFAASQPRTGLEGFEATGEQRNAMKNKCAPARERTRGPEFLICEPLDAAFPPKKPFTRPHTRRAAHALTHTLHLMRATVMGRAWGRRRSASGSSVSHTRSHLGRRRAPLSAAYEPYSLTTLVSSAGLSSSAAAREPPCRPGRSQTRSERQNTT